MMQPEILAVAINVSLNLWNEFVIAVTLLQNESNVTAIVKFYNLRGHPLLARLVWSRPSYFPPIWSVPAISRSDEGRR
ncbi:MAG TPA: hypothetical protein VMU69_11240 [Bradyrhizobium sp.]|nr:hypothetical protein [Bradyrhizobium sp.]